MRTRLLQLRLWLENNGLVPQGRLAFIAWYFLALDILLFVLQKLASVFHQGFGAYLGVWIVFLSLVVVVLFLVIAIRRLSFTLLWSLRNRLIVTYVFIGVIPIILLAALAVGAFYLFAGQVATLVVTSRLESEMRNINASSRATAAALAKQVGSGTKPEVPAFGSTADDFQVLAWVNGQLVINNSNLPAPVPPSFPAGFAGIVRDGENFFLRAVASAAVQ